ncbi:RNI-like protein, partial [Rhodotorula sp. JG-1b]
SDDDDDDDESDFHAEGDPDDPEASTVALSRLGPALATPKQTSTSSPWPFTATPSAEGMFKPASDAAAAAVSPTAGSQAAPGNTSQGINTVSTHSSTTGAAADAAMLLSPSSSGGGGAIPASALPHEILLHILRLLPPTSLAPALRVCKAWCQCGVELLWYKPTFTSLPSLYKMLQVLSHPDQTFPYPDFVRRLNFLPLAKEMSDRLVAKILPCTRLERITLTNCKALSSPAIAALLIRSHRLVALDLTDVESVDDEVLIALAENCPRLQGLNLSGCVRVTDRGLEALALKATGMRRIKLRKCDQLTDVPIMLLSIHCPLLLEIDLAFCTSVSQHAIMQLFRTSTCLREISLPGCTGLTDEGFPDANELQLVSAGDVVHHQNGGGAGGSTSGFSLPRPQPIRSPPAYKPFDQLRYIDVTSCGSLTDAAVAGLAKYCPKVRNLMLGKCTRLTDDALFAICGIGKHLHYLHLGHVHNITDRAVTAIARACTRLRYIDLANCINLTDQSVVELANNLPRLKRIGLVRVNNITDAAIEALSQRTSLERIHLSYCDNLTVSAISSMLQELPRVTHLSLTGVSSFRKRLLQQFCRAPPSTFNDHQRRSFCVFSGRGVVELRKFLRNL